MHKISFMLFALLGCASFSAQADANFAAQAAQDYTAYAQRLDTKFMPSADDGRAFYTKKVEVNGKDLSCSACHTDSPANTGKHNETGRAIKPLAPSVNPKRFSNRNKSEMAFSKHCRDLYGKDCAPGDKANYVTYLLTIKE